MVRPGVVRPGVVRPGVVRPGVVRPGVVRPGVVRPGVVRPGVVRPGVMGPGPVRVRPWCPCPRLHAPVAVRPVSPAGHPHPNGGDPLQGVYLGDGAITEPLAGVVAPSPGLYRDDERHCWCIVLGDRRRVSSLRR